ncbi:hypothetical protein G5I_03210 [Acromyrmex echinatior]|uniref:Uncharacterized protein n=1 Tax=Acromyrmex echinatior TaxID=103372 RepID=F4WCD6_ACREC|nr:hypothetical protein G5I_03210 [Acromyrmex echinatior]
MQVWNAVYHYTVVVPRIRWADTQCGGMFGHEHQYIRQLKRLSIEESRRKPYPTRSDNILDSERALENGYSHNGLQHSCKVVCPGGDLDGDGVAEENSSTYIRMSETNESEGDEETREEEIKVRARKEVRIANQWRILVLRLAELITLVAVETVEVIQLQLSFLSQYQFNKPLSKP